MPCLAALLAAIGWIWLRGCEFEVGSVARYIGYVVFYVWLPGNACLWLVQRRMPTLVESIALGMPFGFSLEIATFLLLSALGARGAYPFLPIPWLLAVVARWRRGHRPSLRPLRSRDFWTAVALAVVLLGIAVTAVSQLFIASPLVHGQLAANTLHDWIYLIGRAAEIKTHWPLQDPSMAGEPLSYHYFLLTHIAAASTVTGDSLAQLLLRSFVFPVGLTLVMQAYLLGRKLSGSQWGGVLAAFLLALTEEVSFTAQGGTFLNLFVRWLYLSPTFYFGMIFTGALVVWVHRLATGTERIGAYVALAALAASATGAKATVVPPMLAAIMLWIGWDVIRARRFPFRLGWIAGALGLGFASVYFSILTAWGSAGAQYSPWVSMQLTDFWRDNFAALTSWLAHIGLSNGSSDALARVLCGLMIFAGAHGVRLLGFFYGVLQPAPRHAPLVIWLTLTWIVTRVLGHFMLLDSNGQLYILYSGRLAISALAAAALFTWAPSLWRMTIAHAEVVRALAQSVWRHRELVAIAGGIVALAWLVRHGSIPWWGAVGGGAVGLVVFSPGRASFRQARRISRRAWTTRLQRLALFLAGGIPIIAGLAVLLVQTNHWRLRNAADFKLWLHPTLTKVDPTLDQLRAGLDWLRTNSEPNAIVVANAFTPRHLRPELWSLDSTTVDKHYFYSAISERRLWVEGPSYLRNQPEANRRMALAGRVFYFGLSPQELPIEQPVYLLVDRALHDPVNLPSDSVQRVFVNDRVRIFRVVRKDAHMAEANRKTAPAALTPSALAQNPVPPASG